MVNFRGWQKTGRTPYSAAFILFAALIINVICVNSFADETAAGEVPDKAELSPIYSAGPWRGRIIDVKTKEPIQGAVVAALWYREYNTGFTLFSDFHDAREVITDQHGRFDIPAYTETGSEIATWRKPEISGPEGPIELTIGGFSIKDPKFIIYKQGYYSYPGGEELIIFAADPAYIKYKEFYIQKNNGQQVSLYRLKEMDLPEGLIYSGRGCYSMMGKLFEKTAFRFRSVYIPLKSAGKKIEMFDIPLDCPGYAEPVPLPFAGYRNYAESPLKRGGYVIIELLKLNPDQGLDTKPEIPFDADREKLPLLNELVYGKKEKTIDSNEQKQKLRSYGSTGPLTIPSNVEGEDEKLRDTN